jgi:hypothetical protein
MSRIFTAWPVLLLVLVSCRGNKALDKDEAAKPPAKHTEKASADQPSVELDAAAQQTSRQISRRTCY